MSDESVGSLFRDGDRVVHEDGRIGNIRYIGKIEGGKNTNSKWAGNRI